MKYIDTEKLKEALKKHYTDITVPVITAEGGLESFFRRCEIKDTIKLIDSLQQEQPKKSKKDCDSCPHCVDRKDQYGWHFKGCFGGPYNGKFIAEIDECPLTQEQPEVDLEKESLKYFSKILVKDDETPILCDFKFKVNFATIARHFYELGKNSK